MIEHNFIDASPITGTRVTNDGYLVGEALVARTGCQQYAAADFGLSGGGSINVYRPESVVFAKDSLATFAGKPVTMNHPREPVTAENWKSHAIGDIGVEIARDGEYIRVPYKIMDGAAIAAIQRGDARELSMGYTTPVEMRDGIAPDGTPYQAIQTGPIRINHLAVVPKARGGSMLRIGDADWWGATPLDQRKDASMPEGIKMRLVMVDGLSVETTDAGAQAIDKLQKAIADAAKIADTTIATKDAELATKDAEITSLTAKVLDAAALDKLVQDRSGLIVRAKVVFPTVVTDGKTVAEIKKAAVVGKSGPTMADKSESYIDAMFDILADEKPADPVAKALADAAKDKSTPTGDVYANRNKELSDAWKNPMKEGV